MPPTAPTLPLEDELVALGMSVARANERLSEAGYRVNVFDARTMRELTTVNTKTGLGIQVQKGTLQTDQDGTVFHFVEDPDLYWASAAAANTAEYVTAEQIEDAKCMVLDLVGALGIGPTNPRETDKLPDLSQGWNASYCHWLGRVLRRLGYDMLRSDVLNGYTFGALHLAHNLWRKGANLKSIVG